MRPRYKIGTLVKLKNESNDHFFVEVAGYSIDATGLAYFAIVNAGKIVFTEAEVITAFRPMRKRKHKVKVKADA